MRLYDITTEMRMVQARLVESIDDDGEIPTDLAAELDGLAMNFEDKAESCCQVRAELEAEAAGYDAEIARLTKLSRAAHARADWLKNYVYVCMEQANVGKISGRLFKMRIQKNSRPSIRLADGEPIPEDFKRIKEEFDGQKAYDAWKAGEALPACVEVVQGTHLRIS